MFAIPLTTLIQHSLIYGSLLSVLLSAVILITLYRWPMIWVSDAPADIQAAAGPMSAADRRVKKIGGALFLVIIAGVVVAATLRLAQLSGGELAFPDLALSTFLILMTFNVVDLLLIDWLLVVTIRPSFAMLPGTEAMAAYADYGFHFRGFLKGTAGIAVVSLALAAAAVGIARVLS